MNDRPSQKYCIIWQDASHNALFHKNLIKYSLIILFMTSFLSCTKPGANNGNYPQNPRWSTSKGEVKDSLKFYFPERLKFDTVRAWYDTVGFSTLNEWSFGIYGSALYAASEPVLYNYYLGHDIYRFLWIRSFDFPTIISLHRKDNKVWITVKKLDKNPGFEELLFSHGPKYFDRIITWRTADSVIRAQDSIVLWAHGQKHIFHRTGLQVDRKKQLTISEWNHFEHLLKECNYWRSYSHLDNVEGVDGARWIIEAHTSKRYWLVDRWSPEDAFRKCGEYLFQLSELKDRFY